MQVKQAQQSSKDYINTPTTSRKAPTPNYYTLTLPIIPSLTFPCAAWRRTHVGLLNRGEQQKGDGFTDFPPYPPLASMTIHLALLTPNHIQTLPQLLPFPFPNHNPHLLPVSLLSSLLSLKIFFYTYIIFLFFLLLFFIFTLFYYLLYIYIYVFFLFLFFSS